MDEEKRQKKKSPLWAFASAGLAALGFFFRFALRGYVYWGYFCFFVVFLILAHRFLPAVLWKIILVLTCIGFVYFWIVEIPIIRNARTDPDPERPYLVVLGAAVYGERPSLTLVRRMEGALDYLESYPESVVIVSGGMGKGENITEAQAMRDWLVARGIAEERVLMEPKATSTEENLKDAAAGEHYEHSDMYKGFAETAREEGCDEIAEKFEQVGAIEKEHEARYLKLRDNIEHDVVFKSDKVTVWKCRNCGHIYVGEKAPETCPVCLHPQSFFEIKANNY